MFSSQGGVVSPPPVVWMWVWAVHWSAGLRTRLLSSALKPQSVPWEGREVVGTERWAPKPIILHEGGARAPGCRTYREIYCRDFICDYLAASLEGHRCSGVMLSERMIPFAPEEEKTRSFIVEEDACHHGST